MTHFDSLQRGCDSKARAILRARAAAPHKATTESAELSAAALSDVRRQAWRYPLWACLGGVAWPVLALWLITSFTKDSNPVVLLFETTGICAGPVLFVFGLCWLFRIVGRRRRVQLGQWVAYPARVAIVRLGPLWWTVVGLEITPTATVVIYPEQLFRSRIRRLVEREGQLLVLVLPPDSPAWFLYAGPSGRPVFAEMARTTGRYGSWQVQEQRDEDERPALAALARARDSAL